MESPNSKSQTTRTRRQTYIIPKRSFAQRYPMVTVWSATVGALLIFFSRPLYDAFIREPDFPDIPADKRREAILKAWKI